MNVLLQPKDIAKQLYHSLIIKKGYAQSEISQLAEKSYGESISQPSISRILNGDFDRSDSRKVAVLCKLAGVKNTKRATKKPDPRTCATLMDALKYTWDGSDEHANSISRVIKSLKKL